MFEGTPLSVEEGYVKGLEKTAKSQHEILSIFYNQDGTLKPDAFERIAMAKDGKALVVQQAQQLQKRAASVARQEIVAHTAETTPMTKTGDSGSPTSQQEAEQKARKHVASILPDPDKNTY